MDILDGTDTAGPIRLSFTREEFDQLCAALVDGSESGSSSADTDVSGAILRFRATFVPPRASITMSDGSIHVCGEGCYVPTGDGIETHMWSE